MQDNEARDLTRYLRSRLSNDFATDVVTSFLDWDSKKRRDAEFEGLLSLREAERAEVYELLEATVPRGSRTALVTLLRALIYSGLTYAALIAIVFCFAIPRVHGIAPPKVANDDRYMFPIMVASSAGTAIGLLIPALTRARRLDWVLFVLFWIIAVGGIRAVSIRGLDLFSSPMSDTLTRGQLAGFVLAFFGAGGVSATLFSATSELVRRVLFRELRASRIERLVCLKILYVIGLIRTDASFKLAERRREAILRLVETARIIGLEAPYVVPQDLPDQMSSAKAVFLGISLRLQTLAGWLATPMPSTRTDVIEELRKMLLNVVRGSWGSIEHSATPLPSTRQVDALKYLRTGLAALLPLSLLVLGPHFGLPRTELPIVRSIAVTWTILSVLRHLDPNYKEPIDVLKDLPFLKPKA